MRLSWAVDCPGSMCGRRALVYQTRAKPAWLILAIGSIGKRASVFSSRSELTTYLPVVSEVKPLQFSNFERQVLFLLTTPTVYRATNIQPSRTENERIDMKLYELTLIGGRMALVTPACLSAKPKPVSCAESYVATSAQQGCNLCCNLSRKKPR
jgi:hypothetical protein